MLAKKKVRVMILDRMTFKAESTIQDEGGNFMMVKDIQKGYTFHKS